mgnify:CR=1 FL=1
MQRVRDLAHKVAADAEVRLAPHRDTGALDLIHAAARALLAAELVMAGEERK